MRQQFQKCTSHVFSLLTEVSFCAVPHCWLTNGLQMWRDFGCVYVCVCVCVCSVWTEPRVSEAPRLCYWPLPALCAATWLVTWTTKVKSNQTAEWWTISYAPYLAFKYKMQPLEYLSWQTADGCTTAQSGPKTDFTAGGGFIASSRRT